MQIDKKSWHYRLYDWTYLMDDPPFKQTNLCQYMRRLMLTPMWVLFRIGFYVIYSLVGIMVLFGGLYPTFCNPRTLGSVAVKEYPLPTYKGLRVLPIVVMIPLALIALTIGAVFNHWHFFLIVEATVILLILFLGSVLYIEKTGMKLSLPSFSFAYVVGEWVEGKKNRFCPTVEFISHDEDTTKQDETLDP